MKVKDLNTNSFIGIWVKIPNNFKSTPQVVGDPLIAYENKYKEINEKMYVAGFWTAVFTSGVWLKREKSDKLSYPLIISPKEFLELEIVAEIK